MNQSQREYSVFDVAIDPAANGRYTIRVIDSPYGQARESVDLAAWVGALQPKLVHLEEAVMAPRYDYAARDSEAALAARTFGIELFEMFFPGSIATRYYESQAKVGAQGRGLRIQLRVNDENVYGLPWECLFDPEDDQFVGLRVETSVVRYPELKGAPRPFELEGPVRVLGVVVELEDDPPIDARRERRLIDDTLAGLKDDGSLYVRWLDNPTWRQLDRALHDEEWHVFHYVGHARPGFITLNDNHGAEPGEMPAQDLADLLGETDSLRLALINACEGARGDGDDALATTAQALARADISAVVAMQYKIIDEAAIKFSPAFYEAIARGQTVDEAMVSGRQAMHRSVEFTLQWMVPVLHMRSANGTLFAPKAGPAAVAALAAEGRSHFRADAWGMALNVYNELVELDAPNPVWRCWRGLVQAELGQPDAARGDLQQALRALSAAVEQDPGNRELLGLRGLAAAALDQCEAALADLGAAMTANAAGVAEYLAAGRCHVAAGSPNRAIADFTNALRLDPGRADAYYRRAQVHAAQNHHEDALEDLTRAVELAPDSIAFRKARAATYQALRDFDSAARDLTMAIEDQPDDAGLYMQRGELRYQLAYHEETHDYTSAIADFGHAVDREPLNPRGWYLRGRANLQMADETGSAELAKRATEDLTEAARLDNADGKYHHYLGLAQRRQGNRRLAKQSLSRAVELGYQDAEHELGFWARLFPRRGS